MAKQKKEAPTEKQARHLQWILHEWDCVTLQDALQQAENDPELKQALQEAGAYKLK